MSRTVAFLGSAGAIASLLLRAPAAYAGADQDIAAEALFDEGKHLMTEGKFAQACEKLEQSERIDAAVGTLLYLAECYEKSGRTASAWVTFREASSAARAEGETERSRIGQERAARLEPLLVKLTVNVPAGDAALAGFVVKRGTERIPQALWGSAVPVDPGEYDVQATAPGYEGFSRHVVMAKDSSTVDVPMLRPSPEATVPPPPPPPAAPLPPPPRATMGGAPPEPDRASGPSGLQVAGLAVAGVGVISIGVGAVFGVKAISKNDDAKKYCSGTVCRAPQGESLSNDANTDAVIANVTIGVGAAAVVGGALMYFLSPSKPRKERALSIVPAFSAREIGAVAEGRF